MHLSLLVERFVPIKVICVRNKDKPWFNDDCRLVFDIKQWAHLQWTRDRSRVNWDEFVHYQRRVNAVYAKTIQQFSFRSRDVLMNAQCPHKWWSIFKSAVFGSSSDSSLSSLLLGQVVVWSVSRSGRQICCRPILMERSPGIQSIRHPLTIRLSIWYYLCLQVTGGEAAPA